MTDWKKTQEFYKMAGIPDISNKDAYDSFIRAGGIVYEKPREQVEFERWVRKVTDRTGNFRVNKEDNIDRPVKIVDNIIRIREDIDRSEGYIISKQTWIGLTAVMDEFQHTIDSPESYWKPTFRYKHRETDEGNDIENIPVGKGPDKLVFTQSYEKGGREYMDQLMAIASPRVDFSICTVGRQTRVIPVRTFEDLRNKRFAELIHPKYWTEYDADLGPNTPMVKKKIASEVVA